MNETASENKTLEGASVSVLQASQDDDLKAPESPTKKKKKKYKSKGLHESAASLNLEDAPESPRKESKSHKLRKSSSALGASASSGNDASESGKERKSKKSSSKKKKEDENSSSKEMEQLVSLVTDEIWTSKNASALQALYSLLQTTDETRQDVAKKHCQVSVQIGAPLLVLRKMKEHANVTSVQSTGLQLIKCWTDLQQQPTAPWFELVTVGALDRVKDLIMGTDAALQDQALALLEQMAVDATAAKLLMEQPGSSGLAALMHLVRIITQKEKEGNLVTRAVKVLRTLCTTAGTAGRKKITEEVYAIVQQSENTKLLKVVLDLLGEMVGSEDTVKGLVQGKGVPAMAHAFEVHMEENPAVSKQAFDLLLSTANNGGSLARQAIADSDALGVVSKDMRDKPKDADVQKRGCQLILAMAVDQRKAVKESGVLTLISKIFTVHRKDRAVLKVAHDAMDAMVK